MFKRLFAERGISLDRLRTLVEVGAAGGIARAAGEDLVRQSLFSRQLKELEEFFQTGLTERHGKGIRLTSRGKELARISRFFLMGLSNFQRGCRAEAQVYRIGAGATFIEWFLIPGLAELKGTARYEVELESDADIERRLHELTLEFGIVQKQTLSRPLHLKRLVSDRLLLWVPAALCRSAGEAMQRIKEGQLPLAWAKLEMPLHLQDQLSVREPALTCGSFTQCMRLLVQGGVAAFLPACLRPRGCGENTRGPRGARGIDGPAGRPELVAYDLSGMEIPRVEFFLAWNPRLLRLNPHAARQREALLKILSGGVVSG